jgi:4-hydroxybenzoyl-CoA thioesterase
MLILSAVETRMTSFIHRTQITVEWGHCDPAGMVHGQSVFTIFDTCTWLMFEAALGVPVEKIGAAFAIMGFPLVGAGANFKAPLRFGDCVDTESNIGEFKRSSFTVQHRLLVKGALAVDGYETRVWVGHDATKPSGMSALPIPADVIARFKPA